MVNDSLALSRLRWLLHDIQYALRFSTPKISDADGRAAVECLCDLGRKADADRLERGLQSVRRGDEPTDELVDFVQSLHACVTRVQSPAVAKLQDDTPTADGITRQEVAKRLERLRSQGEPFTSQRDYAERFNCSTSTVNRAIKETPSLHPWAKPETASAPKAQSLTEVVMDNTPQQRELDPANDMTDDEAQVTMRRLIEEAPTEKRAELHQALSGLPPDELRRVLATYTDADDLGNRVLARHP